MVYHTHIFQEENFLSHFFNRKLPVVLKCFFFIYNTNNPALIHIEQVKNHTL